MRQITKRRMSPGGTLHEHIVEVYVVPDAAQGGEVAQWWKVVDVINSIGRGSHFYVLGSAGIRAFVQVRDNGRQYIQTIADGLWGNNLLALPEG
jgi:hypothetical protein